MKKNCTLLSILIIIFFSATAQEKFIARNPKVITGNLVKITGPVKDFKRDPLTIQDIAVRDEDGIIGEKEEMEELPELPKYNKPFTGDGALQKIYNQLHTIHQGNRSVTNSFSGNNYSNVTPADPSIAAGPNHVIQMVNGPSGALFSIYNKTGLQLTAPIYLDNITGKGGLGDPIAMYDQLADRFVMTEFVNKNETGSQGLSIAVSTTNDPTGSWYVYFFSTGTTFPDYPKFSVWADAYYAKTNDFNSTNNYVGSSVYAFDRNKMLAGNTTAGMQIFLAGTSYRDYSMCPVTLQGKIVPPAGTGGLFAFLQEDVWTGSSADSIGIAECKVDFVNSANSGLVLRSSMAAASYSSSVCGASRSQCITQPGTTILLEALDQRIMNQPVYRNFGSSEGIVFTNVVNNGTNVSALRWYELVKSTGNWDIRQQSTFSPDNVHRFMPGICYDKYGNIALAYNVSGDAVYPGIRYTGRKQCDPLNTMTYAENSIVNGTASNANSRYGDYSQLICDPNGSTFWFTGMYNVTSHWSTIITSFSLDTCISCLAPAGLSSTNITTSAATLSWKAAANAASYSIDYKQSGSTTWTNATTSTTSVSINITGLSAGTGYDWRVTTNCAGNTSGYSVAQFSTTANLVCNPPSGVTASNITNTGATLSWTAAANALSYAVDYKIPTSSTWISAASTTTSLMISLTGLYSSTLYDYRVSTNCQGGNSSYAVGQLTTAATVSCNAPGSLITSAIKYTGATLNWAAVQGASNYAVDYKKSSSSTWSSLTTGTTALTNTLTNLTAGTGYDWRVKTICGTGSSLYSTGQFSTLAICPDQLEPNNTLTAAKAISVNTNLLAQISSTTDIDYYSFSNTSSLNNIQLTLTNLPANYDMKLYSPSGALLATSQNTGLANETINYNTTVTGSYKVMVYGYNKAYSTTSCYTLKAVIGSTTYSPEIYGNQLITKNRLTVYPVPASGQATLSFYEAAAAYVTIYINDGLGKTVHTERIAATAGENKYQADVSLYPDGVYFIKIANATELKTAKLIIAK